MIKQHLVSVIVTTCNRCELLPRAIDSVINQTYKNIEIIVVDDCSNDNTRRVVEEYIQKDGRIKYLRNKEKSGANVSRNRGILASNGTFIAGLDDDDEFLPDRIKSLLVHYDENFAFVTSLNLIYTDGCVVASQCPEVVDIGTILDFNILMNQALMDKQRLIDIGLYDEELEAYQDYDVWVRLMLRFGSVKVVQQCLQIVYFDSNRKRISTKTKNQFYGYFNWYKKHKNLLTVKQRKNHLAHFYKVRNKKISKYFISALVTTDNIDDLISLYSLRQAKYRSFQELTKRINSLNNGDKYLLCGFGSLGKYVFSLLSNNIVGILDKNLTTKFIKKVPVLGVNDLDLYRGSNIIITAINSFDEIRCSMDGFDLNFIEIL